MKFRILFKLCTLAYNIVDETAPKYLLDIFSCYQPTFNMALRVGSGRDDRMLMNSAGNLPYKCIFQRLLNAWNDLPYDLRNAETASNFKKKLENILFFKGI